LMLSSLYFSAIVNCPQLFLSPLISNPGNWFRTFF
jgi:hypothetical protein